MKTYVVQKGDTLWLIAKRNGISLESLIAANPQIADPNKIDVGWVINIPVSGTDDNNCMPPGEPKVPEKMERPYQGMQPKGHYYPEGGYMQHPQEKHHILPYIVKAGETMWLIAKKFGIGLDDLIKANPQIPDPNKIDIGQKILVPQKRHYYAPMPYAHPMPSQMPTPMMPQMMMPPMMPHMMHHYPMMQHMMLQGQMMIHHMFPEITVNIVHHFDMPMQNMMPMMPQYIQKESECKERHHHKHYHSEHSD